jgi:hypothetical protein
MQTAWWQKSCGANILQVAIGCLCNLATDDGTVNTSIGFDGPSEPVRALEKEPADMVIQEAGLVMIQRLPEKVFFQKPTMPTSNEIGLHCLRAFNNAWQRCRQLGGKRIVAPTFCKLQSAAFAT